jgi:pyruvate formate lyase activating enzyme
MKIGGLVPFTLSDFPGRVAAVVFTKGCNFRCPFCHNGGLLAAEGDTMPESDVLAFLAGRRSRLGGVVISGGEPTLQADLADFCRKVKALGLAVKLDTNGSRPDVLAALFAEDLVDFVAMDVKAPASGYDRLAGVHVPMARLWESLNLIAASGLPHQFRTTYVPTLLSTDDLQAIHAALPAGSPHKVNAFRADLALDPDLRGPGQAGREAAAG